MFLLLASSPRRENLPKKTEKFGENVLRNCLSGGRQECRYWDVILYENLNDEIESLVLTAFPSFLGSV